MYATNRAIPDTCTSIAFMKTRLRAPDEEDWAKLENLMRYFRGTIKLSLDLSANGSGILKLWVDELFAVHPNMRGNSGGGLYLGRGLPVVSSTKHKINMKISMDTEIMGVDNFMPAICWN